MHPVLFTVGGFELHAYGAMGAVAFVVGCALVLWRCRRAGYDLNAVADVIFWTALAGLLGSRLTFVAQHPEVVQTPLDLVFSRDGGLVFYGAFILGLPVGLWMLRRANLPALPLFDIFATAWPLSHGISRVGCLLAGCCYGLPTDQAWAITFPLGGPIAPGGVALHPVQLYEATLLVGIAALTNAVYAHRRFDGQVLATYLGSYALVRAFTETFRGDVSRGYFLPEWLGETLSFSQGISIGVATLAAWIVVRGWRREGQPASTSGSPPA